MTLPVVVSEAAEADLATAFAWYEKHEREIPGKRYMRACGGAVIRYGVS